MCCLIEIDKFDHLKTDNWDKDARKAFTPGSWGEFMAIALLGSHPLFDCSLHPGHQKRGRF